MDSKQNYGIAGLGLMGGAIAIALREKCGIELENIFGCDKDPLVLKAAEQEKIICQCFEPNKVKEMFALCDVVFLCLNPRSVVNILAKNAGSFKPECLVTDIAGTKCGVVQTIKNIYDNWTNKYPQAPFDFIPGHPMAGFEKGGFINARNVDFTGRNYILTPLQTNKQENLEFLKNLILKMGFGNIVECTPQEHDSKIAFTSQLCHIIASALIDCEPDTEITRFGGGSFEDLTRIAMLNVPMWTEIFIENRRQLIERISQFEKSLDELKALIGSENTAKLEKRLEIIRDRRISMSSEQ